MSFRRVALADDIAGQLWLSSMPGRSTSWREFLDESARRRLALVLCLAPLDEVADLAPDYHQAIERGALPFDWLALPMRNYGLPLDMPQYRAGIERAGAALRGGEAVLLHCAAGIGRTGSAAACLLKHLGTPLEQALKQVRAAGSSPENALQSGLVNWF